MANEVVERTSGRIKITDNKTLGRACNMASAYDLPVEILNTNYQLLGYIVSKEYIAQLKRAAQ